ncbi:MAG: hypothetical protein WBE26_20795 [Phycisphaerae bacterium]
MKSRKQVSRIIAFVGMAVVLVAGCAGPVDPAAEDAFLGSLGNTSITVFPAFVRDGQEASYDANGAERIGEFLIDDNLAEVTVSQEQVPVTGPWHSNQARMLRESAEDFATYLRENPVENEYAVLPEYLFLGGGGVGGIHCYIIDGENRLAFVVLLNSHWPIFAEMDPKTVDDCTDVLIEVLREDLKPKNPDD